MKTFREIVQSAWDAKIEENMPSDPLLKVQLQTLYVLHALADELDRRAAEQSMREQQKRDPSWTPDEHARAGYGRFDHLKDHFKAGDD